MVLDIDEVQVVRAPVEPELSPSPIARAPPASPLGVARKGRRRDLRLTPLIAAAAVGAGGLLALFLLIGLGPPPKTPLPTTKDSGLSVGDLVGGGPKVPAAPTPPRP